MKPFDLEAFKKGQKALTRDGRVVTFVGVCDECAKQSKLIVNMQGCSSTDACNLDGEFYTNKSQSPYDLVSMVSRHQHLIDSYDPEDTWQYLVAVEWVTCKAKPAFDEYHEYRLHPHNDLIKAWKKGAKIETFGIKWYDVDNPSWSCTAHYRIKPEPVIHCLAYDAKRFNHESTTAVRARVVKKEVAQANGWTIIQEWEV